MSIGKKSKKRLLDNPGVVYFSKNDLDIYIVKDFLTEYEKNYLKGMIKSRLTRSGTLGRATQEYSDFRTSSTSYLGAVNRIVHELDVRIADILDIDPGLGESMQGQHYSVGQAFKPHCDFFHEHLEHWKHARRTGGQRTWTAMLYLDDEMEGGETRFVNAGFKIKPQSGMLVIWNNLTENGTCNWQSLHESIPITEGEKTILTKWYRERMFREETKNRTATAIAA